MLNCAYKGEKEVRVGCLTQQYKLLIPKSSNFLKSKVSKKGKTSKRIINKEYNVIEYSD